MSWLVLRHCNNNNNNNCYYYCYYYIRLATFFRGHWVSQHQKGRNILDFNEARDDGWQWHQLDHMKIIYISLQTDNHASTLPFSFYKLDALLALLELLGTALIYCILSSTVVSAKTRQVLHASGAGNRGCNAPLPCWVLLGCRHSIASMKESLSLLSGVKWWIKKAWGFLCQSNE